MKKQLAIAAGILLTLGTAVAATVSTGESQAVKPATVEVASTDVGSKESVQILALWKAHAVSAASAPLARPL